MKTPAEILRRHLFIDVNNSTLPPSEFAVMAKPSTIYAAMEEYARAESQAKDTRIRELEADRDEALKIADDRYDELSRILYNRGEQAIAFIEWVITHPDKWMFSKKLMTWWSPYLSEDKSTKQLFELYIECKKQLTK